MEKTLKNGKNWHERLTSQLTVGQRVADMVASGMGSWRFIIIQSLVVLLWIAVNIAGFILRWDPYPFILLNLLFSTQAAYAAPIIMMSQNRQNERDRFHAEEDFQTNVEAKKEIEELQEALARIENEKLNYIMATLEEIKADKSIKS
jgi:uncharacterized membrane protein